MSAAPCIVCGKVGCARALHEAPDVDELAGDEGAVAKELRGTAKVIAVAAGRELVGLFAQWVKTRPLKRLIAKRRAAKRKP
jgi:hypothetical protein